MAGRTARRLAAGLLLLSALPLADGLAVHSHSHAHARGLGSWWWPWQHKEEPSKALQQQAVPVAGEAAPAVAAAATTEKPPPANQLAAEAAPKINLEAKGEVVEASESPAKVEEAVVVDEAGAAMLRKWVASGPKQSQELKELFQKDTWVRGKLNATCGKGNTSCAVVALDRMLCEALEVSGFQGMLGSTMQLQGVMNSTMNRSSSQFGVDTKMRAELFKFSEDLTWPASSRDDGSAFPRLLTRTLESAPLKGLVEETCDGFDQVEERQLEACQKRAPRALLCQALTQAASRMKDSDELVPLLVESSKLRGNADEIMSSVMYSGLADGTKSILNMSSEVSFDNWLRSGSDIERTLRAKCIMGHAMRQYVELKCQDPLGDCAMQVYDAMICGAMQRLGDAVATPDIEKGVTWLISQKAFLYEVATRRGFVGKFKMQPNGTHGPELDQLMDNADYKLRTMKKRVLANSTFQTAVSRTCVPLNRVRPSCWDTAPTNLFCQALSAAVSQTIGPAELFKLMQSKKAMVPNTPH